MSQDIRVIHSSHIWVNLGLISIWILIWFQKRLATACGRSFKPRLCHMPWLAAFEIKSKFRSKSGPNSVIPVTWGTNGSRISKDKIRQRGDQIGNHITCHNTFVGARLLELSGDTHTWPHRSFSSYHHLLPHFRTHPPLPFSFCSLQSLV